MKSMFKRKNAVKRSSLVKVKFLLLRGTTWSTAEVLHIILCLKYILRLKQKNSLQISQVYKTEVERKKVVDTK